MILIWDTSNGLWLLENASSLSRLCILRVPLFVSSSTLFISSFCEVGRVESRTTLFPLVSTSTWISGWVSWQGRKSSAMSLSGFSVVSVTIVFLWLTATSLDWTVSTFCSAKSKFSFSCSNEFSAVLIEIKSEFLFSFVISSDAVFFKTCFELLTLCSTFWFSLTAGLLILVTLSFISLSAMFFSLLVSKVVPVVSLSVFEVNNFKWLSRFSL